MRYRVVFIDDGSETTEILATFDTNKRAERFLARLEDELSTGEAWIEEINPSDAPCDETTHYRCEG